MPGLSRLMMASAAAAALLLGAALLPLVISTPAEAACEGAKIDRTTVEDARKKAQGAGYQQLRDFRKGCDNFWHLKATKGGNAVNLVISPTGEVLEEGG